MTKRVLYLFALICALLTQSFAASTKEPGVAGTVVNETGKGAEFATVVLTKGDSSEVAGAIADSVGRFVLRAPAGKYTLAVHYLGYEVYKRAVTLSTGITKVENIALTPSSTIMQSVEVSTRLITREADRFVVSVANNPIAIGKTALEMLPLAPGVWIKDGNISINGKSGTKVMINERMLNLSADEMEIYLKNINAEDIHKIEVIPISGADYDADSQGGIIKITLKRQRADGIEGNMGIGYSTAQGTYNVNPSANLNYRNGDLSLYTNLNYNKGTSDMNGWEKTKYTPSNNTINSTTGIVNNNEYYNVRAGMIYDISSQHNIGAEGFYTTSTQPSTTDGVSDFNTATDITHNTSHYRQKDNGDRVGVTVNYLYKIDTIGSTFKFIGDFNSRVSGSRNDYYNAAEQWLIDAYPDRTSSDTTSRSNSNSDYKIYSATASLELKLSPNSKLSSGLKYTYNRMDNNSLYEGYNTASQDWTIDRVQSLRNDYSEKIAAVYAIFNTKFKTLSLSAGLRGEYTNSAPRTVQQQQDDTQVTARTKQSYFSMFPTVNISIPLNKAQSNSIILAYSRKISRPGFWALNPFRIQLSEYSYITGNPLLNPTFRNDYSMTTVLKYKYTLTVGATMTKDGVSQIISRDPNDPDMVIYRHENIASKWDLYLNANAPINIRKWWTLNANATVVNRSQELTPGAPKSNNLMFNGNATTNFTLPKNFFLEANYYYMSRFVEGNMIARPMHNLSVSAKKRFAKDHFTASISLNNIIKDACHMRLTSTGEGFSKNIYMRQSWGMRRLTFSLRYNFRSGISFKERKVESGSADDAGRMGGK